MNRLLTASQALVLEGVHQHRGSLLCVCVCVCLLVFKTVPHYSHSHLELRDLLASASQVSELKLVHHHTWHKSNEKNFFWFCFIYKT